MFCFHFLSIIVISFVFQFTSSNKVMTPIVSKMFRIVFFGKERVSTTQKKTFSFCKNMLFGKDKIIVTPTKISSNEHVSSDSLLNVSEIQRDIGKAMSKASSYLQLVDWELIGQEDGIKVWRLKSELTGDGMEWPCIKSTVIVDMKPEALRQLFMDSERVHLLNK